MRAEHTRMVDAHRRVLDQLATGVAIFNAERKLIFYNTAFRSLFEADAGFLDQTPSDSDLLERLRSRPQAARGAKLPGVEERAARGLSRGRDAGAHVVPAGRPHLARGHRAQSGRRRHLSLRRRHRAARPAPPLRRAHQGAGRDARQSGGSGGGVRLRRPRAPAQSGVPAPMEADAGRARSASACGGGHRLVPGAARRRRGVARIAWRGHRHRRPRADRRAHRTARRRGDRSRHHAAAGRRHAGHLPDRHRHGEHRARAARAQRGAGRRRPHQDRLRPPRLLRAALAADQHHRLRQPARRRRLRPAHRQAARISRLHHHLDQRAARHHQQHPRSRHHRRRRHEPEPRRRSTSAPPWKRRRKACWTGW